MAAPGGAFVQALSMPNFFRAPPARPTFLEVANLVTVLDAGDVGRYLASSDKTARRKALLLNDRRQPLSELVMEQIEWADLLVLNKGRTAHARRPGPVSASACTTSIPPPEIIENLLLASGRAARLLDERGASIPLARVDQPRVARRLFRQ